MFTEALVWEFIRANCDIDESDRYNIELIQEQFDMSSMLARWFIDMWRDYYWEWQQMD